MSSTKKLVVVLSLLALTAAASACADSTGPRPESAPCESQGSNTRC